MLVFIITIKILDIILKNQRSENIQLCVLFISHIRYIRYRTMNKYILISYKERSLFTILFLNLLIKIILRIRY